MQCERGGGRKSEEEYASERHLVSVVFSSSSANYAYNDLRRWGFALGTTTVKLSSEARFAHAVGGETEKDFSVDFTIYFLEIISLIFSRLLLDFCPQAL